MNEMGQSIKREQWLNQAIQALKPIFNEKGYAVPKVNEIFISPKLDEPVDVLDEYQLALYASCSFLLQKCYFLFNYL
jgi:hypothetical protein